MQGAGVGEASISHFRGCSGEHNRLVRAYHSGDSSEIDWILRRLKENNPRAKIYAVGVSLGGNVLLKWLGEQGDHALEDHRESGGCFSSDRSGSRRRTCWIAVVVN